MKTIISKSVFILALFLIINLKTINAQNPVINPEWVTIHMNWNSTGVYIIDCPYEYVILQDTCLGACGQTYINVNGAGWGNSFPGSSSKQYSDEILYTGFIKVTPWNNPNATQTHTLEYQFRDVCLQESNIGHITLIVDPAKFGVK